MKYCPITYDLITAEEQYSQRGLKLLSPRLKKLEPLHLSATEQRQEAIALAGKMSLPGLQPKLSALLKTKESKFEIVDHHGQFILKPQSEYYSELPENEALTMTLAAMIGIEVPLHGLLYSKDNSKTYFVKRFDRMSHNNRLATEDFAQLSLQKRNTKYNSSMEKIAKIMQQFCSFPNIEAVKLLKLTLFNFLIGNEDMHLKNFSLMVKTNKVMLSPAYDLLNTTIVQQNTQGELALPLKGKKNNLFSHDFLEYFAVEQLQLNQKIIMTVMQDIELAFPQWKIFIHRSFLSHKMKEQYLLLLEERYQRLRV